MVKTKVIIGVIILVANLTGFTTGKMLTIAGFDKRLYAAEISGSFPFIISPRAKVALVENGFVVVPSRKFEDIPEVYKECRRKGVPIFLTTDAILHTTHILLDYTWRIVEIEKIRPSLIKLTQALLDKSFSQYKKAKYPNVKEAALRNVMFFSVALKLLDESRPVPDLVKDKVKAQIKLIDEHKGWASSPVFEDPESKYVYQEDYSQYIPRGHYTRNEEFKSFFKAMMWYGRSLFPLPRPDWKIDSFLERTTRQALLITLALSQSKAEGGKAFKIWEDIHNALSFFIGESDDLTFYDYKDLLEKLYGKNPSLDDFENDEGIKDFILRAMRLKEPKIESGIKWTVFPRPDAFYKKGFKFLGQRYTPDSYIFQNLVYPEVEDRFLPKGLDIMAVFNSKMARSILQKEGDFKKKGYREKLKQLEKKFSNLSEKEWTKSLYWMWLYSLKPLLKEKKEHYPLFMRNKSWVKKSLNTSLASWAELRHDTILYVKQSYTPLKAVLPSFRKSYVEPYPLVYKRIKNLIQSTRESLSSKDFLPSECERKLKSFEKLLSRLEVISQKELEKKPLSLREYHLIWNIGFSLSSLTHFSKPVMEKIASGTDSKMMLVVDVHTDANTHRVLEEAVGYPFIIYVMVSIEGKLTLTRGAVFSYYEFTKPMDKRLTDEKWQEMLKMNEQPPLPEWTRGFVVEIK